MESGPLFLFAASGFAGLDPALIRVEPQHNKQAVALAGLRDFYMRRDISWSGSFVRNAQARAHRLWGDAGYLRALTVYFDHCLTEDGWFRDVSENYFYVSACGEALIYLYQATGTERYCRAITHLKDKLLALPCNSDGILMDSGRVEIELFYCVLPFLAAYQDAFDDPEVCALVVSQALIFFDRAWNESPSGLPLQSLNNPDSRGWSRGLGWFLAGLGKVLSSPGIKQHPDYPLLAQRFVRLAQQIESYQQENGMWRSVIQEPSKPWEVTGTALMALGLELGFQQGLLPTSAGERVDRALKALEGFSVTGLEMTSCFPMNFEAKFHVTDFSGVSDQGYGTWMELFLTVAGRSPYGVHP